MAVWLLPSCGADGAAEHTGLSRPLEFQKYVKADCCHSGNEILRKHVFVGYVQGTCASAGAYLPVPFTASSLSWCVSRLTVMKTPDMEADPAFCVCVEKWVSVTSCLSTDLCLCSLPLTQTHSHIFYSPCCFCLLLTLDWQCLILGHSSD